ncbi:hypothetical protein V1477_011695 [Vespula maculifrons]|uniref:Uncharacterized protein n=1 Tax=Vespula maculifrons TaxID=7453 RepID=A0ABD2BZZ4_VESMC
MGNPLDSIDTIFRGLFREVNCHEEDEDDEEDEAEEEKEKEEEEKEEEKEEKTVRSSSLSDPLAPRGECSSRVSTLSLITMAALAYFLLIRFMRQLLCI